MELQWCQHPKLSLITRTVNTCSTMHIVFVVYVIAIVKFYTHIVYNNVYAHNVGTYYKHEITFMKQCST